MHCHCGILEHWNLFAKNIYIVGISFLQNRVLKRLTRLNTLNIIFQFQFNCNDLHGNHPLEEWTTNGNETRRPTVLFNNSKHNKNIGTLNWIFIVGVIFYILMFVYRISTPLGWITVSQSAMYGFVHCCCVPVLLPTIYFMRNPKHFISVLQDHNLM